MNKIKNLYRNNIDNLKIKIKNLKSNLIIKLNTNQINEEKLDKEVIIFYNIIRIIPQLIWNIIVNILKIFIKIINKIFNKEIAIDSYIFIGSILISIYLMKLSELYRKLRIINIIDILIIAWVIIFILIIYFDFDVKLISYVLLNYVTPVKYDNDFTNSSLNGEDLNKLVDLEGITNNANKRFEENDKQLDSDEEKDVDCMMDIDDKDINLDSDDENDIDCMMDIDDNELSPVNISDKSFGKIVEDFFNKIDKKDTITQSVDNIPDEIKESLIGILLIPILRINTNKNRFKLIIILLLILILIIISYFNTHNLIEILISSTSMYKLNSLTKTFIDENLDKGDKTGASTEDIPRSEEEILSFRQEALDKLTNPNAKTIKEELLNKVDWNEKGTRKLRNLYESIKENSSNVTDSVRNWWRDKALDDLTKSIPNILDVYEPDYLVWLEETRTDKVLKKSFILPFITLIKNNKFNLINIIKIIVTLYLIYKIQLKIYTIFNTFTLSYLLDNLNIWINNISNIFSYNLDKYSEILLSSTLLGTIKRKLSKDSIDDLNKLEDMVNISSTSKEVNKRIKLEDERNISGSEKDIKENTLDQISSKFFKTIEENNKINSEKINLLDYLEIPEDLLINMIPIFLTNIVKSNITKYLLFTIKFIGMLYLIYKLQSKIVIIFNLYILPYSGDILNIWINILYNWFNSLTDKLSDIFLSSCFFITLKNKIFNNSNVTKININETESKMEEWIIWNKDWKSRLKSIGTELNFNFNFDWLDNINTPSIISSITTPIISLTNMFINDLPDDNDLNALNSMWFDTTDSTNSSIKSFYTNTTNSSYKSIKLNTSINSSSNSEIDSLSLDINNWNNSIFLLLTKPLSKINWTKIIKIFKIFNLILAVCLFDTSILLSLAALPLHILNKPLPTPPIDGSNTRTLSNYLRDSYNPFPNKEGIINNETSPKALRYMNSSIRDQFKDAYNVNIYDPDYITRDQSMWWKYRESTQPLETLHLLGNNPEIRFEMKEDNFFNKITNWFKNKFNKDMDDPNTSKWFDIKQRNNSNSKWWKWWT